MTAKLFAFTNTYLSDLQKGLQTAHLVGDMSWDYTKGLAGKKNPKAAKLFEEWRTVHRTIIIFNGGNHETLGEMFDKYKEQRKYPVGLFQEDHQSLRGAHTVFGIILPDPFDSWEGRKTADISKMSDLEIDLINLLDRSSLA